MMAFKVLFLRRAQADVDVVYQWLAKRSSVGAANWYAALLNAAAALEDDPNSCPTAPEAKGLRLDIRQRLFKTPRGRNYRILFVIAGKEVRVLRVRGPGQAPLKARDIR
jgi:plasmid stabilization system protein ParE